MIAKPGRIPVLIAIMTAAAGISVSAQEAGDEAQRPRIGLVLGGGGARGAAHIGILRELERRRIPVDAIAGTSMGAVVGGLYAAGMSAAELEELIAAIDWNGSFSDISQRKDRPYRRKQDDRQFPMQLELGWRDRELQIPLGFVQGQNLGLILREQTLDVAAIDDFDELPIPFRAVASDIETGEPHVLSNGDLATAMRASMAVPGVLAPVVVDGHTLVDGGLVGNVPVSVIESMDVDVIIAVDVEFPLYESADVRSALDITAQMLTILIRKETLRQISELGEDDILVRPDLGNFGSTEFGNITQAIEPGAAALQRHATRLDELALDEAGYAAHLEARQAALRPVETLDFVRVVDSGPLSSRVLEVRLKTDPGESPDAARLTADAARLHGLQVYEQVDYRVVTEGGQTGVEFHTRPKAWGPNFLQFGLALEDDFQGETSFNLSSRLTRRGVNRLGGEWRTDLQIGTEPHLRSEFYQPLSFDSRYFIAPQLLLGQTNFNAFSGPDSIARYRVSNTGVALDVGRELGLWGEFRFGTFRGNGSARVKVGDPTLPSAEFDTGGMFASFNVDTLDNAQIPLHGMRMYVDWTMSRPGFGADERFDLLETGVSGVWTSGRHTFNAGVRFNTSYEAENLVQNYFPLGGFLNLSGLVRGEISGPHAGVARLVYYRRSGEITPRVLEAPLYLGVSVEAGNAWQFRSEIDAGALLFNGSLFAGVDTFFGPLFVGAGWAEGGGSNFYLSFGQSPP